jgi:hypothetical protein
MGDLALGASAMKVRRPLPAGGPGNNFHLVGVIESCHTFDLTAAV